jgi:hypothetical protein
MKHLISIFILLFFIGGIFSEQSFLSESRGTEKGVATLSIAMILKGLGTHSSRGMLIREIHKKCKNYNLIKKWLNYLGKYKDILMMTNKKNSQDKIVETSLHTKRILFIRSFLKTIWSCGENKHTKKATKKISNAYFATINSSKKKVFNFVRTLKFLFLKKSDGKSSIYSSRLTKRIHIIKKLNEKCKSLVKKRCGNKRNPKCNLRKFSVCKRGINKRRHLRKIIRIVFAKHLSKAFVNYIRSFKIPKI